MDIIVYRIGEMVSAIGATMICLIFILGTYWILRSKLNPQKITERNLRHAMTMAYKDVFDEDSNLLPMVWEYPEQAAMHDALSTGNFNTRSIHCMINPLCNWMDEYNHWKPGTTYGNWMQRVIQYIQV